MILANTGRRFLLIAVVGGFLIALGVMFYLARSGAAAEDTMSLVIKRLLKVYLPLLVLMGAFYFSEKSSSNHPASNQTSIEAFFFALAAVSLWCALPTFLLFVSDTFDAALRLLDAFEIFGETISVAAMTYYFSISAPEAASR